MGIGGEGKDGELDKPYEEPTIHQNTHRDQYTVTRQN